MSTNVNETLQKDKLRSSKGSSEEGFEQGLSVAPPPFQLSASPTPPPEEKNSGGSGGDGNPIQKKSFPNLPPETPSADGGSGSVQNGTFQLKASADASSASRNGRTGESVSQPFQLKKDDGSTNSESRDSFAIQRKEGSGGGGGDNGGGGNVMGKMESAFGQDFSNVNIHTNSSQASSVGALAYTQGNDIHFAPGQFSPESKSGQELLGHELTHVVQQRNGDVKPTTEVNGVAVNDDKGLEKEADDMGKKAAQFKLDSNSGQNLKSGNANGGVVQNKLATSLDKSESPSAEKSGPETQIQNPQTAEKKVEKQSAQENTDKSSPQGQEQETKFDKEDADGNLPSSEKQAQTSQNPQDDKDQVDQQGKPKAKVPGQDQDKQDQQQSQDQPQAKVNAPDQEDQDKEVDQQKDDTKIENDKQEADASETPATETPAVEENKEADKEEPASEEKKEGEEEGKEKEEGKEEEGKEEAAAEGKGGEGKEGAQGGAQGGAKGKGGPQGGGKGAALGGGAGAGAGAGGGGGLMGLAKAKIGGGNQPEGDFSKARRPSLFIVPKERASEIPQKNVMGTQPDGSLIARSVASGLVEKRQKPAALQNDGPVQMKTPGGPEGKKPPITPIPKAKQESHYNNRDQQNNSLLDSYKKSTSAEIDKVRGLGSAIEGRISGAASSARSSIQKQTSLNRSRVLRQFNHEKKASTSAANKAIALLKSNNVALKGKIKSASKTAKGKVESEYKTTMAFLAKLDKQMSQLIDQELAKGAGEIRQVGVEKGNEAVSIAQQRADAYAGEALPSMSRTERFFKGGDYYKRKRSARVEAAKKVGAGYKEQFVAKADEAAKGLEAKKAEILQGAREKMKEANEKVKAKKKAAIQTIDSSEKSAIEGADQALEANTKAVKAQLKGAITQLTSIKTKSLKGVDATGKQQLQLLDAMQTKAIQELTKSHAKGISGLEDTVQRTIGKVTSQDNPDPAVVEKVLARSQAQVSKAASDLSTQFNKSIDTSRKGIRKHEGKARDAFEKVYQGARQSLQDVTDGLRKGIHKLKSDAKKAETEILKGHKKGADDAAKTAVKEIQGLKNDTDTGFGAVKKNIGEKVKNSKKELNTEFGKELGKIHGEITKKAKEAADAVKPKWKQILAIVIKVLIAIAVSVAIGLLAASGIGLLAGLGLAFVIGAAGAILETALTDLLVENKFSGWKKYLENAVIGGIGGMFTFVGARVGNGAGGFMKDLMGKGAAKFGLGNTAQAVFSKVGEYFGEVGVGFIFDQASNFTTKVVEQLFQGTSFSDIDWGKAWGETWSTKNVLTNLAMGTGGKMVGDVLTARGIGGEMGRATEWINSKLPRWAMSNAHIAKIDAAPIDVNTNNVDAPKLDEPEVKVDEPEAKVNEPTTKVEEPEAKVNEPTTKVEEPETKLNEPETKVNEPETKVNEPETKTDGPESTKTDTETKTEAPEVKTGAQIAQDLGYPAPPTGYQWVRNHRTNLPYLRRVGVPGGSPLIPAQFDPATGTFKDPNTGQIFNSVDDLNAANSFHTTPSGPSTVPTSPEFNSFKNTGGFADDIQAAKAFELYQQGKWLELETFMRQNGLNGNWPPNDGFVSRSAQTLAPGTRIDRYGHPGGKFVAPEGTPYTNRALKPGSDASPYYVYEVVKPVNVEAGAAIPWFGENGMGTQFLFDQKIQQLVDDGILKVIVEP